MQKNKILVVLLNVNINAKANVKDVLGNAPKFVCMLVNVPDWLMIFVKTAQKDTTLYIFVGREVANAMALIPAQPNIQKCKTMTKVTWKIAKFRKLKMIPSRKLNQ